MTLERMIPSIKPSMLKSFLSRHGWKKDEYSREHIAKYVFDQDSNFSVLVPEDVSSRDYDLAIFRAINIIAQMEAIDPREVLGKILTPNQDVLKFRISGAPSYLASLPLDYLINAATAIHDSLVFSACAEIHAKPHYSRKLKEAVEKVKKTRFGQTDVGSFVLSVEVPLEQPVKHGLNLPEPDPFGRRIVARLMRSLIKAKNVAIDNEVLDVESEYIQGINANIAESLTKLASPEQELNVTVSPHWDYVYKIDTFLNQQVELDSTVFSSLESIGQTLRGSSVSQDVKISGFIVRLSRDGMPSDDEFDEDDQSERVIVLKPETPEDLPTKTVKVLLSARDYIKACDAHRDRKRISIQGRLERIGQWQLTSYRNLKIAR